MKINCYIYVFVFLFALILPSLIFALDKQGKQAGKATGRLFNNTYKSESSINSKLNTPLTKITPLSTVDGSKSGNATTFCGVGDIQDEKIAFQVKVLPNYIYTYSDTNNDGFLDSNRSFNVSKVCLDGYFFEDKYYKWTVSATGYISTINSEALNGCVDPTSVLPTYVGGSISQLYASSTGKTITNSSFTGDIATYYVGQLKDCNNNTKDISATKYYDNPYKINDDSIAMTATCSADDPVCQAYQGISSSSTNVSTSPVGSVVCSINRIVIDSKGPHNGIICNPNEVYYPNSMVGGICYKKEGSTWDYNSSFIARCDSFGKNLILEGWAFWEGAPCGVGDAQSANWPPKKQLEYALNYGGNASPILIGKLSVNRRNCGDNCTYNDSGDTSCYSTTNPLNVYLTKTCSSDNSKCNYIINIENTPSSVCSSFTIVVNAPVGEEIDNQCIAYERDQNCYLVDEYWYDSSGNSVQTIKNGSSTNSFPATTCKDFSAHTDVCKEWWNKSRVYKCGGGNKYNPNISNASRVINSADYLNSYVTFETSQYNKEFTPDCIIHIDYEYPFTTLSDCTAMGGKAGCPPGYNILNDICVSSPSCPQNSWYNPDTDYCETSAIPHCDEDGYIYNVATKKCEKQPSCPIGSLNSETNRCEAIPSPKCELDYSYNSNTMKCESQGYCEEGIYNSSTHLCQTDPVPDCHPSYRYNHSRNICELDPPCVRGTYIAEHDRCEYVPSPSCPNNFDYNSINNRCESQPICLLGTYNPSTKFCEYLPSPECPIEFSFNESTNKCQNNPNCLLSAIYDSTNNTCYYQPSADCPTGYSYINDRSQCEGDPMCSSGIYNSLRKVCEKERVNGCPLGYMSSPALNLCQADPICAYPGIYNTDIDICTAEPALECPFGTTYYEPRSRCEVSPTCYSPYTYNNVSLRCERLADHLCSSPYVYNADNKQCELPPDCPPPSVFNASHDKCEKTPDNQCESGFTWNSSIGYCTYPPICEAPAIYSDSNNRCEKPADNYCPTGLTYDALGYCWESPICEAPAIYSDSNNRCEKPADNYCVTPYSYNSTYDRCQVSPPCNPPATYNTTYDRCHKPFDNYCESPFTYDGSSNCITNPPCDSPSTYNTSTNRCEMAVPTTYTCPSTGQVYSSSMECSTACGTITSSCNLQDANITVNNFTTASINNILASGDFKTLYFYSGGTTVSTIIINSSGMKLSTSAISEPINKINCYGSYIGLYDNSSLKGAIYITSGECNLSTITCPGYVGRITQNTSNSINVYDTSGNFCGSLFFSAYTCPINSSISCTDTSPRTCSINQCTTSSSCPSGFTKSGSICYKSVACPNGSSLNTTTDKCYKSVTRCTDGYTNAGTYCYKAVTCPDGGSLTSDLCVKSSVRCLGTSYTYSSGVCYKSPTCSSGLVYSSSYDRCQVEVTHCLAGYTYSSGICYNAPTCPVGSSYSSSNDTCITNSTLCLDGYTWNATYNVCQIDPQCKESGTFSPLYDVCYKSDTICTDGSYSVTDDICYKPVICPGISIFDNLNNVCYQDKAASCPINYEYSSTHNVCTANSVCDYLGVLEKNRDKCELPYSLVCDDEFVWNSSYNICQKDPSCIEGILDSGIGKCVIPALYGCTSPFVYSNNRCENAPVCYSGSSLNIDSDKCELDPAYNCEQNYSLNQITKTCQKIPDCYSPGTFDALIDKCKAAFSYYCDPYFSLDPSLPVCYIAPNCPSGILNPQHDVCESSMFYSCLNPKYNYNSSNGACEGLPVCIKGTYNTDSYICETDAEFCLFGYTFDSSAWLCHNPPFCNTGVYNNVSLKCETPPQFCPLELTFNEDNFICRANAYCTRGNLDIMNDICHTDIKCTKSENRQFSCKYANPSDHTGLYCDDSSFSVQDYEVRREILMKCQEYKQCEVVCMINVPDGTGGYKNEKVNCIQNADNNYECPNGSYSIVRACGCALEAFDGNELKESNCTVSCIVVSPGANPDGNVHNDYLIKECTQSFVGETAIYNCPLSGAEYIYQNCGCIDSFGLSAGVLGALIEGIRDKECIK